MQRKNRGFTLIELLIVVLIVGLLAALLVPNAVRAIQRAKQKGTMKDLNAVATVMTDYLTDKGFSFDQNGTFSVGSAFYSVIVPYYIEVLPTADQWNNPIHIYGQQNCDDKYGITSATDQDYVVASLGNDNISEEGTDFVTTVGSGMFRIIGLESFNNDLVIWNGDWLRAPLTMTGGPGS